MRSAWLRAMRQAAIETLAIACGVIVALVLLGLGAAAALYFLAGCMSAVCI